jgi:hypothetical protein
VEMKVFLGICDVLHDIDESLSIIAGYKVSSKELCDPLRGCCCAGCGGYC